MPQRASSGEEGAGFLPSLVSHGLRAALDRYQSPRTASSMGMWACGHVGTAEGDFWKRCARCRVWEVKTHQIGGVVHKKGLSGMPGHLGGVVSATQTHCPDAETEAPGPRLTDLLPNGSQESILV